MDYAEALPCSEPLSLAGVGLSAFAAGALASMSLISIPVVLVNTTNVSVLNCWRQGLQSGVKVCPPLAIAATIAHALNAYIQRHSSGNASRYLAFAATSTIAIVPFTLAFMTDTNQELFKRAEAARNTLADVDVSSGELVRRWGRLNLLRSVLPALGALAACLTY